MTEIYASINHKVTQIHIDLFDYDDDGNAVWKVSDGNEPRYIEGRVDDEAWTIIDRAARAYDE